VFAAELLKHSSFRSIIIVAMLLTFSRDVTLVRLDPNGHFIALLAEGAGELHPVFESHRDRPFLIQNAQELCFLNVRHEDREHLLTVFITSSDTRGWFCLF